MKLNSWLLWLGIIPSLHAGVRNPFVPPLHYCETTLQQLDRWQLQGVLISSSRHLALMTSAQQLPLRVTLGTTLIAGVTVTSISQSTLRVSLADICDGAYYHWHLLGEKNDKESRRYAIAPSSSYYRGK